MDWLLPTDRLLSFEPLAAILVGVIAGLIFGLLPGINGKKGIILSLPFLVTVDPLNAAVYLVAMHAVVHTCGALPAVLLGLPTSSSEAATILDGYPMVRQGRAAEAIAATIVGSSVGGFLGALALIALIPLGILIVPFIGSPEILGLTSLGLLFVSALSGNSLARGLVVVGLGLLASSVGIDGLTGTQRYTFSEPTLAAGINIAAILAGIFVVPELVGLTDEDKKSGENSIVVSIRAVVDQLSHAARHIGVIVRSSLIGVVVGFIPGIGASVAVWMAYGHTVQTGPQQPPYGEGNVAGLIAVETANNAKEGGSFAPTLMFAVPGTSGMAIMMLAFSQIGIEVGPRLVTEDPAFISLVGWIILAANLVAVPVCLLLVPSLAFIATMRQRVISPLTLVLALAAAVVIMPHVSSLLQVAVFSVVGVALKWANWPRAPMVLGLVIGPIVECYSLPDNTCLRLAGLRETWRPAAFGHLHRWHAACFLGTGLGRRSILAQTCGTGAFLGIGFPVDVCRGHRARTPVLNGRDAISFGSLNCGPCRLSCRDCSRRKAQWLASRALCLRQDRGQSDPATYGVVDLCACRRVPYGRSTLRGCVVALVSTSLLYSYAHPHVCGRAHRAGSRRRYDRTSAAAGSPLDLAARMTKLLITKA